MTGRQIKLNTQVRVRKDTAWEHDELWNGHIKRVTDFVKGYDSIVIDVSITAPDGQPLYDAGLYFMRSGALTDRTLDQTVYMLSMGPRSLLALMGDGERSRTVAATMAPLEEGGRHLALADLVDLLAIRSARLSGDQDAAKAAAERLYARLDMEPGRGRPAKPRSGREYHRKGVGNVTTTDVSLMMGPITNAIMARNSGGVRPEDYFSEDARRVPTGGGGFVMLDVRTSDETSIDSVYREYRLNDRDRFWLDALYTLAISENRTEIRGSEILKLRGYANPRARTSASTMADAARSINKAISTRIEIDVTHEKRRRDGRVISSTRLQPIVNAIIDLDTYEGEGGAARDFTVNLQTPNPLDALPIAKYERARGMFTTATKEDFDFGGMRRVTTDDRQMWSYVLRFIKSKTLGGTILFETMWENLEIEEPDVSPFAYVGRDGRPLDGPAEEGGAPVSEELADRASPELMSRRRRKAVEKQHARMLRKLERMLDLKRGALFESWRWHKDGVGRVNGVTIARAEPEGDKVPARAEKDVVKRGQRCS